MEKPECGHHLLLAVMLVSVAVVPAVSASELIVLPEPENALTQQEIDCIYATIMDDIRASDIDPDVKKTFAVLKRGQGQYSSDAEKSAILTEVGKIPSPRVRAGLAPNGRGILEAGPHLTTIWRR